jgi:hypothetical protein
VARPVEQEHAAINFMKQRSACGVHGRLSAETGRSESLLSTTSRALAMETPPPTADAALAHQTFTGSRWLSREFSPSGAASFAHTQRATNGATSCC